MNPVQAEGDFLTPSVMSGNDWKAWELAVLRVFEHCGWKNLQYIGEAGDCGIDILAVRYDSQQQRDVSYAIQVKAVSTDQYIGVAAIQQTIDGQAVYGAEVAIVVTNTDFTDSAYARQSELVRSGFRIMLWNGATLKALLDKYPSRSRAFRGLREYQADIAERVIARYKEGGSKASFIVATGLGKTIIAATVAQALYQYGLKRILVLCHATDLAIQLQKSFWCQISKAIPTRLFMEGRAPIPGDGINFGLYQTLVQYLGGIDRDAFDLIIVDEAHHALCNGFLKCLNRLSPKFLLGMTATPWRGDGASFSSLFGLPLREVSLIDGMKMGFLAKVDYRLMCDNIDWEEVRRLSKNRLTVRDLNKHLFLPQRDSAVIAALKKVEHESEHPLKIAVFSPSISHAESFANDLCMSGIPAECVSVSDKAQRRASLLSFTTGRIKAITAVDLLNEGIDVPDINVLVFLRATHSRRIFVQQLGRGLRITRDKTSVVVLDFVTDIRRLAAVRQLDKEARSPMRKGLIESVVLSNGIVTFSSPEVAHFIDAWLKEVADLEDSEGDTALSFPPIQEINL